MVIGPAVTGTGFGDTVVVSAVDGAPRKGCDKYDPNAPLPAFAANSSRNGKLPLSIVNAIVCCGDGSLSSKYESRTTSGRGTTSGPVVRGVAADDDGVHRLRGSQRRPREPRESVTLAQALAANGRLSDAIVVLEDVSRRRAEVVAGQFSLAWEWVRARAALAQLYRRAERRAEADAMMAS